MPIWNDSTVHKSNMPDRESAIRDELVATGVTVTDANISVSDITTNNVSTSKHGFTPKAPNDVTQFLRGDGSWGVPSGGVIQITQAAHGFTVGQILSFNGSAYVLAMADVVADSEVVGIVSSVIDSGHFSLTPGGLVSGLSGLTAGSVYFLSPTSAGALTTTEPTAVGQVSKPLMIAISTTSGYFINMRGIAVPAGGGIPQGGPLTINLDAGGFLLSGLKDGVAAQDSVAQGQIPHPAGGGLPNGALAQTAPRSMPSPTNITLTTGQLYVVGIELRKGIPVNSITFISGGTGLSAVTTHQIFGLYDDNLGSTSGIGYTLLGHTSDDTSAAWAASTTKTLSLTATYTPARTGFHYLACLVCVSSGTINNLRGWGGDANIGSIAPILGGTCGSGLTALPDPAPFSVYGQGVAYAFVS